MNLKDIYPLLSSTDFTAPTGFSVILPLVEQNDELCILFEVRSAAISQGGEVCFPGGKSNRMKPPGRRLYGKPARSFL